MRQYDVLIVGGGQAARRAAEGVRAVSGDVSVAIVGEENHLPYDRPPLSKEALIEGLDACPIHASDRYVEARVGMVLGRRVRSLDRAARTIRTEDGEALGYGRLILATGSRVRTLQANEAVSDRVVTLRTREDAEHLSRALTPGARIAVIGAGFIGLEVASAALARGASPIVIEAGDRILARGLPAAPAARILALHRAAGVDVRLNSPVQGISQGPDGAVAVQLPDQVLTVDLVVVGIGVVPNVELAVEAGLAVDDGLVVDETGATSDPAVFGAGEVTRHPVQGHDVGLRLESWQAAEIQAEAAGRSAAGAPTAVRQAPWFWSDQAGVNIQVLGHVGDADLILRDYEDGSVAYFALNARRRLRGVITINAGRDISASRRILSQDADLDAARLADPSQPLRRLLS